MGFQINTNIASMQAQEYLRLTSDFQQKTIGRVTSGLRITSSGDDAAGLAIANGFRSDMSVLSQGIRNANDGLSTLQIIDGGINNISKLLDRARTLATQSASGTFTGSRDVLNSEFQSVLQEINRQAQAVGLDVGGQFAKSLQVFIGGGRTNGAISSISNGSVGVDLARSTVDAQSLGLKGVQASGVAGTDIGSGSAATKVSDILANVTNTSSLKTLGHAEFKFYGPGFGDSDGVSVSVNLAGVTDENTLTAAVNAAIAAAGNGVTASATAFRNANVIARVNTDSTGAKQLAFTSSSTAFQVEAGDRMSNALLGNFEQNAVMTGTDAAVTVATNGGGDSNQLTLSVDGGAAFTVNLTASAALSKGQVVKELNADVTFAALATAHLEGNQIVIRSKGNSDTSSIAITNTTLSGNLGLTGTASAAAASTGADVRTWVQAAAATAAGATTFGTAGAGTIQFRLTGGNLPAAVELSIDVTANTTVTQAIAALQTAVSSNGQLNQAGIALTTAEAGNTLVFTNLGGEKFQVEVSGDKLNLLGMGSFVTGSNGAIDYNRLSATKNYTTAAVGTATFEFSIAGNGSSTNSVAVDLSQGDATAATVTGTDTNATVDTTGGALISMRINGATYLGSVTSGAAVTKATIAGELNTIMSGSGVTATLTADNEIVLTSADKGAGQTIQFLNDAGSAWATLGFTISNTPVSGTSRTGASIAEALNAAFASDPELAAAGLQADFNVTEAGKLTVQSTNGSYFRMNSIGSSAGVSAMGSEQEPFAIVLGVNDTLDLTVNGENVTVTLTAGAARTAAQVAADIQLALDTAEIAATATADNGYVVLSTTATGAGASIEVRSTGTAQATLGFAAGVYSGTDANAGFGVTGVSFTGNLVSDAPTTNARFNAAGSGQTTALDFGVMQYGNDDQTITITANDANGATQSRSIVLRNDSVGRSGRSLDETLDAINTSLQQSNNETLKKIVAVKDNSDGTEKIRFLSSLSSFKVSVGSVPHSGNGIGSAGTTVDAVATEGGANVDISTQAAAEAAVTALSDAVSRLGDAQAVVGRGQNQLNYAINLAQSQLTNVAAAESRIRDADLAMEAANLTKAQIILQAGVAALAQANSAPQAILGLLRG